jgi:hypothetical protein
MKPIEQARRASAAEFRTAAPDAIEDESSYRAAPRPSRKPFRLP